jgi:hypothetical protein
MIKQNFICAFFVCFFSSSAFGLGVGVDAVQAEPVVEHKSTSDAEQALKNKKDEISRLKLNLFKFKTSLLAVSAANPDKVKIFASDNLKSALAGKELTNQSPETLEAAIERLQNDLDAANAQKAQLQKDLDAAKAAQEGKGGGVMVDPQVSAGEGDPSAKVNFRYTYNFKNSSFFTSAVEIGSSPDDTPDNLAAAFATNGGNVNFSLGGGRSWSVFKTKDIRFIPSFTYTYSGFTASELDLNSGGTAEVDTEVQSSTIRLMLAFEEKYFISLDHSYHDVTGKDGSEFSNLLDQERTTVVRAIFDLGDKERLLVLERAHPIGNEGAQLRLSFITSLDF